MKKFGDTKQLGSFMLVCLMFLSMLVLVVPIVGGEGNNGNSGSCDIWGFDNIVDLVDFAMTHNGSIEVVVGVGDAADYEELVSSIEESNGTVVDTIYIQDDPIAVVADVPLDSVASFVEELKATGLPMYLEPNMRFDALWVPDDPYWTIQWGPKKIEADYAWNTTLGDSSILVAVIDTGVDWNHPDLAANYVPLGYDWVNNDTDPMDDDGHGTHCAGIIAAVIDNSLGVAGLAQVKIMAEKVLDYEGSGNTDDLADAIIHAVDQGADILSNSWGGSWPSNLIHKAVKYAYDNGVMVVASAGNEATSMKMYPAAFEEVIAVTATDEYDDPAEFTSFGNWVELAAPGVNIYSTVWNDNYAYMSGTSMAAPHVSGVAALVWSQYPDKTRDWVRFQLRVTADDLGNPGFDYYYGYGRINARKAVEQGAPDHDLVLMRWSHRWDDVGLNGVNATVLNFGANSESSIRVDLLINGSLWDTRYISSLPSGAIANVYWLWWRYPGKLYNLSVYVIPEPGEIDIENNKDWRWLYPVGTATIKVPDDYPTIQEAIDVASPGNTILVASGVYHETVSIDKTGISLIGENRWSTIIDGRGKSHYGILISADEVYVSKFTVKNSSKLISKASGIYLSYSFNGTITDNNVVDNREGILLWGSSGNTITRNRIASSDDTGLALLMSSNDNTISENIVKSNNQYGIALILCDKNDIRNNLVTLTDQYSGITTIVGKDNSIIGNIVLSNYGTGTDETHNNYSVCIGNSRENLVKHNYLRDNAYGIATVGYQNRYNRIYHNNFLNNIVQLYVYGDVIDIWHNRWTCEGNYWSDYEGEDQDGDGVGDTELPHLEVDYHPLMSPWFPGDVNHDDLVDIVDTVIIAIAYGSTPEDPKWNPHADLNEDGVIDDYDLYIVQEHFGETSTTYWEKPLTVLAKDQYGNPLTLKVWIDEELVGYTGESFSVLRSPHEVYVEETYTFSHWEDNSTENPRILIIDSSKTITAYYEIL